MAHLELNNLRIAYDDFGSGQPLVLIHGYPFNRSLWSDQVEALRASSRVITVDLRGFGESEATDSATMNLMAQDIAQLLDSLEIPKATMGGLSMGGYVVLSFYKQFPERVAAMVLADTRASADTEEAKQTRSKQRDQILAEGMAGIADSMLPKLLTPETVSKRAEVVKRIRDMMIRTPPVGAAAALMAMADREDQTALLEKINVPVLILVGREDPITPVKDSELMHEKIRGSNLVVLENASHVSNIEQAKLFNDSLVSFLSKLS